jgi:hypothetical protein
VATDPWITRRSNSSISHGSNTVPPTSNRSVIVRSARWRCLDLSGRTGRDVVEVLFGRRIEARADRRDSARAVVGLDC